jgi:hypothetical protein
LVKSTWEKYNEIKAQPFLDAPQHEDEEVVADYEAELAAGAFLQKYSKRPNFRRRIAGKIARELFLKDRSPSKDHSWGDE